MVLKKKFPNKYLEIFCAKNSQELKKNDRKFAKQNYTSFAVPVLNNLFFSVYQSIATHIFLKFVRPHICWCVSVDVASYLKWGFGRQGRGFESGSWFLRDVGLSPHLGL